MKKRMIYILAFLLAAVFLASCGAKENVSVAKGEGILSSFTTETLAGEKVTETVLSGHKVNMINVWGTYCNPCINEMPSLGDLNSAYGERGFQIIGIPVDVTDSACRPVPAQIDKANQIIASTGAGYLHVLPSQDLNNAFLSEVQVIPYTIFVDENGVQLGEPYIGSRTMDQWEAVIKTLLEAEE